MLAAEKQIILQRWSLVARRGSRFSCSVCALLCLAYVSFQLSFAPPCVRVYTPVRERHTMYTSTIQRLSSRWWATGGTQSTIQQKKNIHRVCALHCHTQPMTLQYIRSIRQLLNDRTLTIAQIHTPSLSSSSSPSSSNSDLQQCEIGNAFSHR